MKWFHIRNFSFRKQLVFIMLILMMLGISIPNDIKAADGKSLTKAVEDLSLPKLNLTKVSLTIGDAKRIKLNNTSGEVTWKSSDKSIASVTSSGKVYAKNLGNATITATSQGEKYICKISVKKAERKKLTPVELYQKCVDSLLEISVQTSEGVGLGSGFFIEENKIVTNYHVIEGASKITVKDYSGKTYNVNVIYDYNIEYDMAVLGVVESGKPLVINDHEVLTGETVYTIGSPYGYTGTFSKGIISLADRKIDDVNYIQITAPLSKGNSGGPLLNEYGEVIGVNTLSQLNGQNINFAVKIYYLERLELNKSVSISEFYQASK